MSVSKKIYQHCPQCQFYFRLKVKIHGGGKKTIQWVSQRADEALQIYRGTSEMKVYFIIIF